MTRISNTNQVIMLLRAQLQQLERQAGKNTGTVKKPKQLGALSRLRSIIKNDELLEEEISEAIVHSILTEKFGEHVVNAPEFRGLLTKIVKLVEGDADTRKLLSTAIKKLR